MKSETVTNEILPAYSGWVSRIWVPLDGDRTEPTTEWPWAMSWSITWAATKPFAPVTSVLGILFVVGGLIGWLGIGAMWEYTSRIERLI